MLSELQWAGILLLLTCSMSPTRAQQLPTVACPEYFEYLSFNGEFIGHIAVRHDPLFETNNLRVEFSQYGAYEWVGFFNESSCRCSPGDVSQVLSDVCLLPRTPNEPSINCTSNCLYQSSKSRRDMKESCKESL